ncbi:DUF72 domain-containing protein [Methanocella sp. MCL-LM]|uniref:DUF72 domain-containing protein n=1 Tax=Methanocella sp. MCL-LM TaxID=3412035 RepID=UPI003C785E77
MIRVGTSGWSYDDWAGAFYPPGLPKQAWLSYYGRYFHTTEINSSFYTFPAPFVVQEWIRKASGLNGFEFSLKMPGKVTHDSLMADLQTALDFEAKVLSPLKAAGALGAVLLQASPYFRYPDHTGRLEAMLEALNTKDIDYAIELRHSSWLKSETELVPDALDILRKHEVALCAVDGPSMPAILENTGRHSYLRLHGRNEDMWFSKKADPAGRMNRYDYSYSREQLEPWTSAVKAMPGTIRAYFNNHPRANAVKNARLFETMLGLEPEETMPLPTQRQTGLSRFFDE